MDTTTDLRSLLRSLPVFDTELTDVELTDVPDDPHDLFVDWIHHAIAAGEPEPHAMTLSTCGVDGSPDARVLILKNLDDRGWWFATSGLSPTGRQLAERPAAALTFHWKTVGRQVRVRGSVVAATPADSAADFRDRSAGARAIALASRQSEPLSSRAECDEQVTAAARSLAAEPDLSSPHWTLYALTPRQIEFWQADPNRQHHRLRYDRTGGGWGHHLLWP